MLTIDTQAWLRTEHNIDVDVRVVTTGKCRKKCGYDWVIFFKNFQVDYSRNRFPSYDAALTAGLTEAMNYVK